MRLFPISGQQPILAWLYWCGYNKFYLNKKSPGKKEKERSFHRLYPFSNQSKEKFPCSEGSSARLNPGKTSDVLNKISPMGDRHGLLVCKNVVMLILELVKGMWGRAWRWGRDGKCIAWRLTAFQAHPKRVVIESLCEDPHIEQESKLSINLYKISVWHHITS